MQSHIFEKIYLIIRLLHFNHLLILNRIKLIEIYIVYITYHLIFSQNIRIAFIDLYIEYTYIYEL